MGVDDIDEFRRHAERAKPQAEELCAAATEAVERGAFDQALAAFDLAFDTLSKSDADDSQSLRSTLLDAKCQALEKFAHRLRLDVSIEGHY